MSITSETSVYWVVWRHAVGMGVGVAVAGTRVGVAVDVGASVGKRGVAVWAGSQIRRCAAMLR